MSPVFRCPHCGDPLEELPGEYTCANGHHFDRAKQGYVNLTLAGRLKGRAAGDSEAMVRARRDVFDHGLYEPVVSAVAALVAADGPSSIVDAGCGEGSYLAAAVALSGAGGWGIDISKVAIRMAAQRHKSHRYAIASSYSMPFADACFDIVINVFSPRDFAEMTRVLKHGGRAIVVTPGPRHLQQLKALIYDDPRHHDVALAGVNGEPQADQVHNVSFELHLGDPVLRMSLLEMTPYWWSTVPSRRDEIAATPITVDIDVLISQYRKTR